MIIDQSIEFNHKVIINATLMITHDFLSPLNLLFLYFQGTKRAEISNLIDAYVCGTVGQVNIQVQALTNFCLQFVNPNYAVSFWCYHMFRPQVVSK